MLRSFSGRASWLAHVRVLTTLCLGMMLVACQTPPPVEMKGVAFYSMQWHVRLASLPEGLSKEEVERALQKEIDAVNDSLSTYQETSEISRINRSQGASPVPLSPLFMQAIGTALKVSEASRGVYDVTVGPLVDLWGFGPKGRIDHAPDDTAIGLARKHVGWQLLRVDAKSSTLSRPQGVRLDLSSVGEGLAVDRMVGWLEARGIRDYMVSVAGSFRVRGNRPDGERWRVGIEKPDGSGLPQQVVAAENTAISTSGAYRNYFEENGVRYSHTIDPRTGRPITHRGVSVTVIVPGNTDCTLADAWATALNAMGPDEGLALAEQQGIAAFFIEKTNDGFRERMTSSFKPYLVQ